MQFSHVVFRNLAFFAILLFLFVAYWFMYAFVPFNPLAFSKTLFLYILLMNFIMILSGLPCKLFFLFVASRMSNDFILSSSLLLK